ncbi:MAG TPA: sigma-70 family RNA polymerase sigma factor [Armatimonadaceae bacterium]|nr:sigma-70 family RNA polymerase sigma factor [Armatimonadaceae bacterium]
MNTLLLSARSGDAKAQDRLREMLRPRLESLAGYYAARTGMDSNDLLQEAWLAVFEALPELDVTVGTPTQYLLKHARWQILDHIRWNKRRSHDALDDLVVETPAMSDNNFGTGSARPGTLDVETRMMVENLETRLSPRQKIILKGLLEGNTWRQIGDSLGCTSANVAYHVRGIRQAYAEMIHSGAPLE